MISLSLYERSQSALTEALHALHAEQEAGDKDKHPKYEPVYAPSNIISLGLLVVGIVYSCFAWKQWDAIQAQAKIAKETLSHLRRQERPWVFVALAKTELLLSGGVYLVAPWLVMRNVGRSPAWVIGQDVHTHKREITNPLPDEPDYSSYRTYEAAIPLAPSKKLGPYEEREVLTEEDWKAFCLGKLDVFVWGMIQYRDASETYTTRFCMSPLRPMVACPSEQQPQIKLNYGYSGPAAYNRLT